MWCARWRRCWLRVTFKDADNNGVVTSTDINQVNNYYPFGLNMEGNWTPSGGNGEGNKYQYNGKEWNDDFGLGWNHHDWRFLDVAINRFVTIDPESDEDEQEQFSPYHFGLDNPIRYDDPDGRNPILGAIVGAVTDIVIQTVEIALDDNKTFEKDFSKTSVLVSAVAGATGVGLASKLGKVGKLAKLGIESAHDFAASAVGQYAKEGKVNWKKAGVDMLAGKLAGEGAGALVAKKAAASGEGKVLANAAERAQRKVKNTVAESGSTKAKKLANQAEKAKEKYNNFVSGKKAVASSTAASGVGGATVNKVLGTEKEDKKN